MSQIHGDVEMRPSNPGAGRGGPFARLHRAVTQGRVQGLSRSKAAEIVGEDRAGQAMAATRRRDMLAAMDEQVEAMDRRVKRRQRESGRRV